VSALADYEHRELPQRFESWLSAGAPGAQRSTWELPTFESIASKAGTTLRPLDDGSFLAEGKNGDTDTYTFTTVLPAGPLQAVRAEAHTAADKASAAYRRFLRRAGIRFGTC
jgi:hypothetical protein